MRYKVCRNHIYEDSGKPERNRLIAVAMPTGEAWPAPGLGLDREYLFHGIPEEIIGEAIENAKSA